MNAARRSAGKQFASRKSSCGAAVKGRISTTERRKLQLALFHSELDGATQQASPPRLRRKRRGGLAVPTMADVYASALVTKGSFVAADCYAKCSHLGSTALPLLPFHILFLKVLAVRNS